MMPFPPQFSRGIDAARQTATHLKNITLMLDSSVGHLAAPLASPPKSSAVNSVPAMI